MTENKQFLIAMGERLAIRRKELKITQEQLAEATDLSLQSISCIELGKKAIRPENLYKICRVLDISADYVLTGERTQKQLEGTVRKLAALSENDLKLIEAMIDRLKS